MRLGEIRQQQRNHAGQSIISSNAIKQSLISVYCLPNDGGASRTGERDH